MVALGSGDVSHERGTPVEPSVGLQPSRDPACFAGRTHLTLKKLQGTLVNRDWIPFFSMY